MGVTATWGLVPASSVERVGGAQLGAKGGTQLWGFWMRAPMVKVCPYTQRYLA